jgi:hypothetical protein
MPSFHQLLPEWANSIGLLNAGCVSFRDNDGGHYLGYLVGSSSITSFHDAASKRRGGIIPPFGVYQVWTFIAATPEQYAELCRLTQYQRETTRAADHASALLAAAEEHHVVYLGASRFPDADPLVSLTTSQVGAEYHLSREVLCRCGYLVEDGKATPVQAGALEACPAGT